MGLELVPESEIVFTTLVREFPDDYVIVDSTYAGMYLGTYEDESCYGPYWDILVLGPGIVVAILTESWTELVKLEKKGQSFILTYLDQDGSQWVRDTESKFIVGFKAGEEYQSDNWYRRSKSGQIRRISLSKIVGLISRSEETFPKEVCRFFANLKTGEASVLPFARYEWKSEIGKPFGHDRLYTLDGLITWLRQLGNATRFDDCYWNEERVRAFIERVGGNLRPSIWEEVEEQTRLRSLIQRDAETISDEALQKEVSKVFPFPLAFSLRRFLTPHDPSIDCSEKLRCAENFLAYLGSLGIALAREAGLSLKPNEDLNIDLVGCWSRGVSAGHWARIIRETARALHALNDSERLPVSEFPSICWRQDRRKPRQGGLAETINALVEHRNRFHHYRGTATRKEVEEASADLQQMLLKVVRGLRFLTRYPLWYVVDCAAQRGSPLLKISYKLCIGDHPVFDRREADHDTFLIRDTLYLKSDAQLLDLTPWLTFRTCPQCGAEAMFFVERIDTKKGVVTFKSFERGHTDESEDHWNEIARHLGL